MLVFVSIKAWHTFLTDNSKKYKKFRILCVSNRHSSNTRLKRDMLSPPAPRPPTCSAAASTTPSATATPSATTTAAAALAEAARLLRVGLGHVV